MCDQLYTRWDLYNWSFVWRISPLLWIAAWTHFKWSLCDVSGGYQYIKSPDVFMQMKCLSNDFSSIHIPSYLSPFLCVVFHSFWCRFAVCRSLRFHPSHFAPLSSLGGHNMWQERKKSRETAGLDTATYIKASKHPPSPRPNIHPHASRARLRFHFIQWSQTNPNIGFTQAFLPATSIPLFIYTSVGVVMFYSSHFHLVVGIFLTSLCLFSLLLVLPLILDFIFCPWCEGLLAQASVNSCQRRVAALS